ncbi:hypothetical protein SAMN02800687_1281 [Curtobacterium sp. UNCCL20]|nr:hypothetical protein SAMN02800687_1281 [Curtobacterium sp. UNCCL20]
MSGPRSPRSLDSVNWLILLGAVAAAAVVMWIADRVGWIDLSNKATRSGGSGGVISMMDEVFAPTRHETQAAYERQSRLPREAPTPADDDHDLLSGTVLIKVPAVRGAGRHEARAGTHDRSY